ncbi:MAG: chorismate mutase [Clostridia bacterium]|nr:chorismate mutase [Clostridia bacterium]
MVRAIRGAITVDNNDKNEIFDATKILLNKMIEENDLVHEDLISMVFTLTPDLNACFPAARAREMGFTDVPLMCMSEIPVEGALEKCVRILINTNTDKSLKEINHVYLREAVKLRRDLAK